MTGRQPSPGKSAERAVVILAGSPGVGCVVVLMPRFRLAGVPP